MSRRAQTLVVVDPVDDGVTVRLGAALSGWLVEHGLVVRIGHGLAPGPSAPEAVEPGWGAGWTAWAPVEVHTGWDLYWPGELYDAPSCPRCRTQLSDDVFLPALARWGESRAEPELACPACGFRAALGDWPVRNAGAAGPLAVEFVEWPPLTPEWAARFQEQIGPRSVWVRAHA